MDRTADRSEFYLGLCLGLELLFRLRVRLRLRTYVLNLSAYLLSPMHRVSRLLPVCYACLYRLESLLNLVLHIGQALVEAATEAI